MYPMGIYKKAQAYGRKAVSALKKRYKAKPGGRKSTGGVRVAKMAKDIFYLKSVLNPEKKRFMNNISNQRIGQVNGNSDGYYVADVTPLPGQGAGYDQRNGASIKLHSSIWHFQFVQQTTAKCRIRGLIEFWEVLGDPYGAGFEFPQERWDTNPFTGVRDMNCQTNPDNFMKAKCIARRNFSVQTDSLGNENLTTDIKIPIKYNKGQGKHIRWDKNSYGTLTNGQIFLVIRCDRGNMSDDTVSTLTVPDVATNTGMFMSYNKVDYFYDN